MPRFAVNLGANDGVTSDPVYAVFEAGWAGLALEADARFAAPLAANLPWPRVQRLVPERAEPPTIAARLHELGTPRHFDLLKVCGLGRGPRWSIAPARAARGPLSKERFRSNRPSCCGCLRRRHASKETDHRSLRLGCMHQRRRPRARRG